MDITKISFDKVSALSMKDTFYQLHHDELTDFINFNPDLAGLEKAIAERQNFEVDRVLIHQVVAEAYQTTSSKQQTNIDLLKRPSTFTIITAHQPSLLGGPAYYIYKICSAINLAAKLTELYPQYNFIPVFINGSEDHDLEEINVLHLFGKTLHWDTNQRGPIGRFDVTGLDQMIVQFSELLGNSERAKALSQIFVDALKNTKDYNTFVFNWVNQIFKKYGLLVVNMDSSALKRRFLPILRREIFERESETMIQKTQDDLTKINFKPQAFAREINVFYLSNQSRERIVFEDEKYKVLNTDLSFSHADMEVELETHPERFSPNVVLRPLYQEMIFPNVAYIGGGGEIAYWLERKAQFEHFGIFFPVLMRRNSVTLLPKYIQKNIDKLGLSIEDTLADEDKLIAEFLVASVDEDMTFVEEQDIIKHVFETIAKNAQAIDPTLVPYVMSESVKAIKMVESIGGRLKRSLKQKEETSVNQIRTIKAKLHPNHGLQERYDSIWQYVVNEDENLINTLVKNLDPLDKDFLYFSL